MVGILQERYGFLAHGGRRRLLERRFDRDASDRGRIFCGLDGNRKFSRFTVISVLKTKEAAVVAEALLTDVFYWFGFPRTLVTD